MDPGFLLIENFGRFVAIAGLLMAAPLFAWAGWMYMSSMGDPNRSAAARNSVICVCVGILIIGGAFIIPGVVSDVVVEPVGGITVDLEGGVNCDQILRDQLRMNREASTVPRMQFVIQQIQSKYDDCRTETWSPVVKVSSPSASQCFDVTSGSGAHETVASVPIPESLRWRATSLSQGSGRDEWGNIIVHWTSYVGPGQPFGHPSDGSLCWMYIGSLNDWIEGY